MNIYIYITISMYIAIYIYIFIVIVMLCYIIHSTWGDLYIGSTSNAGWSCRWSVPSTRPRGSRAQSDQKAVCQSRGPSSSTVCLDAIGPGNTKMSAPGLWRSSSFFIWLVCSEKGDSLALYIYIYTVLIYKASTELVTKSLWEPFPGTRPILSTRCNWLASLQAA